MKESAGVSIVIIAGSEDHASAVNTALRDAGVAAHCHRNDTPSELENNLTRLSPLLLMVFGDGESSELAHTLQIRDASFPNIPVLLVSNSVDEDTIAAAMEKGASDVVSFHNITRLQFVAQREIRSCRNANSLEKLKGSAQQVKAELNSLKQVTTEAIADIQEGIIVNANPAWLELFGLPGDTDLMGYPIMDFCAAADRPALKGGIVACQKGKWSDEMLTITAVKDDGNEFNLAIQLENVEHDEEPAVRMLITPEQSDDMVHEDLIDQVRQRDHSTNLYNRNHFLQVAAVRISKGPDRGVRAIAYLQPDNFARVRSDVGLLGTENIIGQVAKLVRDFAQPNDIYGRFGETMFSILLERGTMADVHAWADKFVAAVADHVFDHEGASTALTCSVGLCEINNGNTNKLEDLLHEADEACDEARSKGGNQAALSASSQKDDENSSDDTIWAPRIRSALMENRLRLEHQPIGSLNEDIDGAFDTLVRMLDDDGNMVLPSEFMPVAERTGLSKNIDRWVIGASVSFCRANKAQLVFVRLSRDSLTDTSLGEWLKTQIDQAGLSPERICLEIPEQLANKHLKQAQALAADLKEFGFRFAIEHFGASENPERVLKNIPMNYVKIDGSLMQGLHKNTNAQEAVKSLARLAIDAGIQTIAERVQDANTMAVLWQLGIEFIQGDYVQNQEIVIEDNSQTAVTQVIGDDATEQPAQAEAPA